jgi:AcrR family transcriptional regulator
MRTAAFQVETRDAILDAMERLLGHYGYRKTTMDDLAREAGIGKGSIYLHFPSKEEVALCSIDRVVDRLQRRLLEIAGSSGSVVECLREMLRTRVLFRFDSVRDYSQGLDGLFESLRPAYMARRHRYFEAERRIFAKVLAEGRRQGQLAFAAVTATADTLLLASNALLPYSLSARELGERADVEKKINRIADVLIHGLLRRQKGRTERRRVISESSS